MESCSGQLMCSYGGGCHGCWTRSSWLALLPLVTSPGLLVRPLTTEARPCMLTCASRHTQLAVLRGCSHHRPQPPLGAPTS